MIQVITGSILFLKSLNMIMLLYDSLSVLKSKIRDYLGN